MGATVGVAVGATVGVAVGATVGVAVGATVGEGVGPGCVKTYAAPPTAAAPAIAAPAYKYLRLLTFFSSDNVLHFSQFLLSFLISRRPFCVFYYINLSSEQYNVNLAHIEQSLYASLIYFKEQSDIKA